MTLPPLDQLKKLQTEVTPGPWKWDNPGVCPKNVGGDIVRLTHGQGEANRQLISLAPPLLETVIKVHEAIEFLEKRWDTLNQDSSRVSGVHSEGFMDGIDYAIGTITRITRILENA